MDILFIFIVGALIGFWVGRRTSVIKLKNYDEDTDADTRL